MNVQKRNRTAARHGWQGEKEALTWLSTLTLSENIQVINTLLDFTCLDTFIEVKTCAEKITTEHAGKTRAGRFTLDISQHFKLVHRDGYYAFVVLREGCPSRIFLVRAQNLPFLQQASWTTALKFREQFPALPGGRTENAAI